MRDEHWCFLRLFAPIFHGAGACKFWSWIRIRRVNRARYSLFSILWISGGLKISSYSEKPLSCNEIWYARSPSMTMPVNRGTFYATFWHCIVVTSDFNPGKPNQTDFIWLGLWSPIGRKRPILISNSSFCGHPPPHVCKEHGRCLRLRWNVAFKLPNINMRTRFLLAWRRSVMRPNSPIKSREIQ